MNYFQTKVNFFRHEKISKLIRNRSEERAICLWLFIGLYCAENETDGVFERDYLYKNAPWKRRQIEICLKLLRKCGLIEPWKNSLRMTNWAKYNYTSAHQKAYRKAHNIRQQKYIKYRKMAGLNDFNQPEKVSENIKMTASLMASQVPPDDGVIDGVTDASNDGLKGKGKLKIKKKKKKKEEKKVGGEMHADVLLPPPFFNFLESHPSQLTEEANQNSPDSNTKGGNFDFPPKPCPLHPPVSQKRHIEDFLKLHPILKIEEFAAFIRVWKNQHLTQNQREKFSKLFSVTAEEILFALDKMSNKESGGNAGLLLKIIEDDRAGGTFQKKKNGHHPVGLKINNASKELLEAHKHYYDLSRKKRWMQPTMKEVQQILDLKITDEQILTASVKGWPELLKEIGNDHVTA